MKERQRQFHSNEKQGKAVHGMTLVDNSVLTCKRWHWLSQRDSTCQINTEWGQLFHFRTCDHQDRGNSCQENLHPQCPQTVPLDTESLRLPVDPNDIESKRVMKQHPRSGLSVLLTFSKQYRPGGHAYER